MSGYYYRKENRWIFVEHSEHSRKNLIHDAFIPFNAFIPSSLKPPKTQAPQEVLNARIQFDGWPKNLANRLRSLGVDRWRDLAGFSTSHLLMEDGIGRKSLDFILKKVWAAGIQYDPTLPRPVRKHTGQSDDGPGVYFIRCEAYIKIGSAGNVRQRIIDIRQVVPYELDALAVVRTSNRDEAYRLERELHKRFRKLRHRGEWFTDCKELRWFIESQVAA